MTDYARQDRRELADLLLRTGPDAPTLCEGWTTRDLAAHLVVRERRPDSSAGMLVRPLAAHGEKVRRAKAAEPYEKVVGEVRNPPWWSPLSNPLTDELVNGVEMFIHLEDVRRAAPGWEPRTLPPARQGALWRTVKVTGRMALRRLGIGVRILADGYGEFTVGTGEPQATISGEPGELAMFVSGRQRAARVTIDADPATADRLRTARLGV